MHEPLKCNCTNAAETELVDPASQPHSYEKVTRCRLRRFTCVGCAHSFDFMAFSMPLKWVRARSRRFLLNLLLSQKCPRQRTIRRYLAVVLYREGLGVALTAALRASDVTKTATVHTLRHSFATQLLQGGADNRMRPPLRHKLANRTTHGQQLSIIHAPNDVSDHGSHHALYARQSKRGGLLNNKIGLCGL